MRIEQLTFTRFIAAIGIVYFHFGRGIAPFNNGILSTMVNNANLGVGYFFVLSGFVMVIAYHRSTQPIHAGNYYLKRIAKIYPLYLIGLLIMLCYSATVINPCKLVAELFLVQSLFPNYTLAYNWPDWSLSVEVVFYLSFPIIYNYFYIKKGFRTVSLAFLIFWAVSQIMIYTWSVNEQLYRTIPINFVAYGPLFHLNEFFAGNVIGLFFISLQNEASAIKRKRLLRVSLLISLLFTILLSVAFIFHFKPLINLHNGLLLCFYMPVILLLALNKGWISKVLCLKPLVFAGEISYCIYIMQLPVFTISALFIKFQSTAVNFYISTALLILISALAYKFIEEPVRKLMNRHLSKAH